MNTKKSKDPEKQCYTCVYGENITGDISCENRTVRKLRHKPDPYFCEFYDEITDDYEGDVNKVFNS